MKKYLVILLALASIQGHALAQGKHKSPCNTMTTAPVKHHHKGLAKHHTGKKRPTPRVDETITIDDHSATAIVNIKDGKVYVNDSLVAQVKNPKNEDHRIIVNYIAPPPQPVAEIEHVQVNSYTAEKPMKGMLGVRVADGCTAGAVIADIIPCSPAESNGLFPGDVITKVNDRQVSNADELLEALGNYNAGDKVSVTYNDYGRTETEEIQLSKESQGCRSSCGRCDW